MLLAVLVALGVDTFRFVLNIAPQLFGERGASLVEPPIDLIGIAAVAAIAWLSLGLARMTRGGGRATLFVASGFTTLYVVIELSAALLLLLDRQLDHLAVIALCAQLAWVCAFSMLFFGLFSLNAKRGRAPSLVVAVLLPLVAGVRGLLFAATMLSPYLEGGSEARRVFLETSTARSFAAFVAFVIVYLANAWLARRLAAPPPAR